LTNGWRCSASLHKWENETIHNLVNGSVAAEELAKLFVGVCGEQLDEHGQNLIRVMAENGRLGVLPAVVAEFVASRLNWTKKFRLT
jgi:F-type H+-transporting ATPase subunit delta